MPRESTIQILRSTSTDTPTGLTFGELAYSDVNGKLFVGRTGGTSLWVGAGITTGSISTNSATLVPTQSAVKTYVDGVIGGGSVVNSVNGTAGAITITGDGGSQLVTVSGTTTTLSNRLASATVTGVASFGNEFVVTSGAVGLTSNYVRSVNGLTGAVVSIATTGSNTFTGLNTFNAGISGTSATFSGDIAVNGGDITTTSATATVFNTTATNLSIGSAATTLTMGATSGGVALIRSGTITLGSSSSTFVVTPAGTANDLYISPNGNLILAPTSNPGDGTNTTLYINGSPDAQGQVQINGGDLYLGTKSVDGAVFTPVNMIFEGSGSVDSNKTTVTVVNPTANRTITLPNDSGTVALVGTTVASVNGATGAITITGAGAITYTQSGTSNTINARLATTSLTGVAYFDSTNFTAAGDGKISITNGTITNAQLVNSSISFAGGGSPSSVSLGGTLTITGTANEVKVTNSGSGTLTLGLPTDVVIGGNLTVNGTVITANVENFVVEDPLIALGTGNAADSVDLGWYGMYTSGSLRYAGTFRDASDGGKFKFFGGLTAQPSATINTSAATYATATIVANIDGGTF